MDKEIKEAGDIAFEEGKNSANILDNPYWKNYPNESTKIEQVKARRWVDGWYERIMKNG